LSYPGAAEICDGLDNDCDSDVPTDETDVDGDGYLACEDCDDAAADQFPEETGSSGWARDCAIWLAADTADTEWYGHRLEQPSIVDDGTATTVYFRTGYAEEDLEFGAISSTDLVNWQFIGGGAVFSGTGNPGDWDEVGVSHPHVLYDPADLNDPYKLFYSAVDPLSGLSQIGMAVGNDGLAWTRPVDAVLTVGAAGELDEMGAAAPYVWIEGATYHMLYACTGATDAGICMATSVDNGASWTRWDPEPGVGQDPQAVVQLGDVGDWDEGDVGAPLLLESGTAASVVYEGSDGAATALGAALATALHDGVLAKTDDDLGLVLEAAAQAGRWDDLQVSAGDWQSDAGQYWMLYGGATEDLAFDGGQVVSLGRAVNDEPSLTLVEPSADPNVINTGDAVDFVGSATDTGLLDQLLVVITSEEDPNLLLTAAVDSAGDFAVTAPGGTFVDAANPYLVTVTVIDNGGLALSTSIVFDVLQ